MTIPSGPPRRYTTSRQLIAGDDFNNLNDQLNSFQALTATGVAQADAAAINAAQIEVLAGSANNAGARLPVSNPGQEVDVLNNSANSTIIYATGTDQIQNAITPGGYAASNAGVTMGTLNSVTFKCIKKGFWQTVRTTAGPI